MHVVALSQRTRRAKPSYLQRGLSCYSIGIIKQGEGHVKCGKLRGSVLNCDLVRVVDGFRCFLGKLAGIHITLAIESMIWNQGLRVRKCYSKL
jgi:hypothetical protein